MYVSGALSRRLNARGSTARARHYPTRIMRGVGDTRRCPITPTNLAFVWVLYDISGCSRAWRAKRQRAQYGCTYICMPFHVRREALSATTCAVSTGRISGKRANFEDTTIGRTYSSLGPPRPRCGPTSKNVRKVSRNWTESGGRARYTIYCY